MAKLSGGDNLKRRLAELSLKVRQPGTLQVGFLDGTYPDGTSVPAVAFWNEYGTNTIPPRPYFRTMIQRESGHWGDDVATVLKAVDYDTGKALEQMGHEIKGELQESITTLDSPALAPSTIRAKGFEKPLIDTGLMLSKVAFRVVQTA